MGEAMRIRTGETGEVGDMTLGGGLDGPLRCLPQKIVGVAPAQLLWVPARNSVSLRTPEPALGRGTSQLDRERPNSSER